MVAPSANWLALRKKLTEEEQTKNDKRPKKLRKIEIVSETASPTSLSAATSAAGTAPKTSPSHPIREGNPDSVEALRRMVHWDGSYPESHLLPGKYIAVDCEMVGVAGGSGSKRSRRNENDESSLARVSIVNYYGVVLLDEFVQQRERVTDWRTAFSGIRPSDMTKAKPFTAIQQKVADLLKDRILVGHAVHNDLECLLLSHPQHMIRDTQFLAGRHGTLTQNLKAQENGDPVKRNKKWSLRNLVSYELDLKIQQGEHSSVIDARATMALYRLHKKLWDKGLKPQDQLIREVSKSSLDPSSKNETTKGKRKRDEAALDDAGVEDDSLNASKERKGISSGLSVVVNRSKGGQKIKQVHSGAKRRTERKTVTEDDQWWTKL